jgi:hypothetical protein
VMGSMSRCGAVEKVSSGVEKLDAVQRSSRHTRRW